MNLVSTLPFLLPVSSTAELIEVLLPNAPLVDSKPPITDMRCCRALTTDSERHAHVTHVYT